MSFDLAHRLPANAESYPSYRLVRYAIVPADNAEAALEPRDVPNLGDLVIGQGITFHSGASIMEFDLAHKLVAAEEGRIAHVYRDTRGLLTIGVGCLVDPKAGGALCDEAIDVQLEHDLQIARKRASAIPGFEQCNDVRQAVLVSMCFQLGELKAWSNFKAALMRGDYDAAAEEGMDSLWAKQTPARAQRQMRMLRTGVWE